MKQVNYINGEYLLNGHFCLAEVADIHPKLKKDWLQGEGDIVINLDGVEKADSSILALLLDWKSEADKSNRQLKINALPEPLQILAQMSGVEALLMTDQLTEAS